MNSESASTPRPNTNLSIIHGLLSGKKPGKVEAITAGVILAQSSHNIFKRWQTRRREQRTVLLKFQEGTEEYIWLVRWIAEQPRIEGHSQGRQFNAKSADSRNRHEITCGLGSGDGQPTKSHKWALVPESFQGFRFENLLVSISRSQPSKEDLFPVRETVLAVITRDMAAIERLLASIHEAGTRERDEVHIPNVMALTTWGDWTEVRKAPSNRMPVLPSGVMETLEQDVKWFLENEAWYQSVGVPYRRGYLFHGIPGSGKTTTAISLASVFGRDIYVLPIAGMSDDKIANAIRGARRGGVIMIEDIDCVQATHSRDQHQETATEAKGPTLGGLLNCIDGVATPEGRIIIASTNHRQTLDPALIRPGRFDRQIEFLAADTYQIQELCQRFGLGAESPTIAAEWAQERVSMATVQERLIERCGLGEGRKS